jgi:hypothetical protein
LATSYNLMNALIEIVILAQYQQHNQRHVNVMRRTVGRIVQRLQNRYHQLLQVLLDHHKFVEPMVAMQQQVQQQGGRIEGDNLTEGVVQTRKVDFEGAGVFFGRICGWDFVEEVVILRSTHSPVELAQPNKLVR